MKVKLKLDMDKVKQFGIEHGEKFVLAGAVALLGLFIVKAASRETLPENLQPDKIDTRSQQADQNIKRLPVPPKAQDVASEDFLKSVNGGLVVPNDIPRLKDEALPDPVKRVDPTLFAVEELQVAWFRGGIVEAPREREMGAAVPMGPAPAAGGLLPGKGAAHLGARTGLGATGRPTVAPGTGLIPGGAAGGVAQADKPIPAGFQPGGPQSSGFAEGYYGIVITGLIPEGAQREEYARRFRNARRGVAVEGAASAGPGRDRANAEADSPQYRWCWLERTDTTDGTVKLLDFGDKERVKMDCVEPAALAQVKELALSKATLNKLDVEMKKWAVQVPEVADADYLSDPWFTWKLPPVLLRNWGAEAAHPPKVPLAAPVAAPGEVIPADGKLTPAGDAFDPAAVSPGGQGPMRRREPVMQRPGMRVVTAEVPYKLFRFIDLEVEPGHAYQYRVRMLLRNPNFGLEPQVLLKPETAFVAYRPTPWSDKSPTILLPQNTRLLAGAIVRPRGKEAMAKLSVFTFDKEQAVELIKEFDTELGALVGTTVPDQTVKDVADPVKKVIHDMTSDFRTPAVLLDFRGNDEKLSSTGSLTDPAEMLLLDNVDHPENPQLIVVNEAKDLPIVVDWQKTHVAPVDASTTSPLVPVPTPTVIKPPVRRNSLIPQPTQQPAPTNPNPTRRRPGY